MIADELLLARLQKERDFWNTCALDPQVDDRYISDVDLSFRIAGVKPFLRPGRVLEIGCGVGQIVSALNHSPSFIVTGIDISSEMIAEARRRDRTSIYVVGDGRTLPFPADHFESVYSVLVFQHLPREAVEGYVRESARVLVPGGSLRVQFIERTEPGPFSQPHSLDVIREILTEVGFKIYDEERGFGHALWTWVAAANN